MEDIEIISFERLIEFGLNSDSKLEFNGYRTGIRPNHWIRNKQYTVIGQIDFLDCEWLKPGESCRAICSFYAPKQDEKLFVSGFKWDIGQAAIIVGYGKVLSK